MQYRTMRNGDKLSVLGFGCMRLPKKGRGIDEDRAVKQIRYAIDHGVNYIDTALMYAGSEAVVAKALADGYREKVKLATKIPPQFINSREDMDKLLDRQLKTLKTDHIDYYLVHSLLNSTRWNKMKELGVSDFLDKAKADGHIVNAGFSAHCTVGDFEEIVDGYKWDFCQIQYNVIDEKNQAGKEGLAYAASKGLGVVIMEPLRGGFLAKSPPSVQVIWDKADVKRTPVEWALRWVWNHPEVTVVLSGMNEEAHIEENLRIANDALPNSLTKKELDIVDQARVAYQKLNRVGCTGCRYCMPCPAGVNIPGCFELYNAATGPRSLVEAPPKMAYQFMVGGKADGAKPGYASQCKNCGACVKKCPQHLDIPKHLKDVAREYETFDGMLIGNILGVMTQLMRWNTMRKA